MNQDAPLGAPSEEEPKSRDAENWAKPVGELHVGHDLPSGAVNLNVEGRKVTGVSGGFGKMWQKTYTVELPGTSATPQQVIKTWREHFPEFWPKGNHFFGPLTGVKPGDVVPLQLKMPGGLKLRTGIVVVYADDESFSYIMPEGGMFGGMITFRARRDQGVTVAEVQAIIRASDPIYELGMMFGGHRAEDKQWVHVLRELAKQFGVEGKPTTSRSLVDKKRQWSHFRNIRKSAVIRSGAYMLGAPFRAIAKPFRRKKSVDAETP
jgi:hypothetical protein